MERGDLTALYVIGENPVQSEADQKRAKHLLSTRDFMVVQDIFLTATAELADVVLPAAASWAETRRDRHELRAARPARPEGARAAGRGARRPLDHRGDRPADGRRLGLERTGGRLGRAAEACRPSTPGCPTSGSRSSAASSGRATTRPSGRAVPPQPALGGPAARAPRAVRAGRPRPAGRQARRRLPHPPHDRAPARLVQHRRPDRRLHARRFAAASRSTSRPRTPRPTASRRASASASCRAAARSRRRSGSTRALRPGLTFMTLHFQDDVATNLLTIDATDPKSGTAEFKATAIRIEKLDVSGRGLTRARRPMNRIVDTDQAPRGTAAGPIPLQPGRHRRAASSSSPGSGPWDPETGIGRRRDDRGADAPGAHECPGNPRGCRELDGPDRECHGRRVEPRGLRRGMNAGVEALVPGGSARPLRREAPSPAPGVRISIAVIAEGARAA